jgi:hypothetical protein
MLPIDLLRKVRDAWKGYSVDLYTLLDNYRVDANGLPLLLQQFQTDKCEDGLFLLDKSGLAPDLLGLSFIKAWQEGRILQQYKTVIWLPFKKLLKLPVVPTNIDSLDQLAKLSDPSAELRKSNPTENLVIITGIDLLTSGNYAKEDFVARASKWMQLIKEFPRLVVGDHRPDIVQELQLVTEIPIAMPPVYMNLTYNKVDNDQQESLSLPGQLLVDEITNHTRRLFRFDSQNPNGVFSINTTTVRQFLQGKGDIVPEQEEDVKHLPPLLSLQDVVRILAGKKPLELDKEAISVLDTPAKWYYAAFSANAVHASGQKQKFFLYQIAGHLVVRQTRDHYIIDLGPIEDYNPQMPLISGAQPDTEVQQILQRVIEQDGFESLNEKSILKALNRAKKAWAKEVMQARNEVLQAEEKSISQRPAQLSPASHETFKKIRSALSNPFNDQEIAGILRKLPKKERKPSYQTIQGQFNKAKESAPYLHTSEQVMAVLSNRRVKPGYERLIVLLSANLLAEGVRFEPCFFAPFAMITLALIDNGYWDRFTALPERLAIAIPNEDWTQLVLADCLDPLGIHPMAYNASFKHTQLNPQHGVIWPKLKTQLLYAQWLKAMTLLNGVSIAVQKFTLDFSPQPSFKLLDSSHQPLIMRDLNLRLRIQSTYKNYNDLRVLSHTEKPFQAAMHLVADRNQLKIITCGPNGEFGYFLEVPRTLGTKTEKYFVHLKPNQALALAIKFDSIGNNNHALRLYNYLCVNHPKSTYYRLSRAQCLALHPELIEKKELMVTIESDLAFLHHKLPELNHAISQSLRYLQVIYKTRKAIETAKDVCVATILILHSAAAGCREALETFNRWDEETPILYQSMFRLYNRIYNYTKEIANSLSRPMTLPGKNFGLIPFSPDHQKIIIIAHESEREMTLSAVSTSLTLCRTGIISNAMGVLFKLLVNNTYLTAWKLLLKPNPPAPTYKELKIPTPQLRLLHEVLLHWVTDFSAYTKTTASKMRSNFSSSLGVNTTAAAKARANLSKGRKGLSAQGIKIKTILDDGVPALLFKISFGLPSSMVDAWCVFHKMAVTPVMDPAWGSCLTIKVNENLKSRSAYQPLLHPMSFSQNSYACVKPTKRHKHFAVFADKFIEFLEKMKQWDISKDSNNRRVSYDYFSKKTRLPNLYLTTESGIQNALIEIPNSVLIADLLTWLNEGGFSYYWVNHSLMGRCLYVPHLSIQSTHKKYDPVISNGDLLHPSLKTTKPGAIERLAAAYQSGNPNSPNKPVTAAATGLFSKSTAGGWAKTGSSLGGLARLFIKSWRATDEYSGYTKAIKQSIAEFKATQPYLNFCKKMKEDGLPPHDVEADGNCFFHAMLDQLKLRSPETLASLATQLNILQTGINHQVLRRLAVGGLIKLACDEDVLIRSHVADIQKYLADSSQSGEWADHLLITVLCRVLGVTAVLINSNDNPPTVIHCGEAARLYLGYQVQRHFLSTRGQPSERLVSYVSEKTLEAFDPGSLIDPRVAYQLGDDVELIESSRQDPRVTSELGR